MRSEKKLTAVRILIYILLAYLPTYIVCIFLVDDPYTTTALESFAIMFSPAAAHILTRLITKEGFSGTFLRANLRRDIKYYLAAILYPILCNIITVILMVVCYIPDYKLSDVINSDTAVVFFSSFFSILASAVTISIICFGEEFGWRAYLTPKLEKLMPSAAALIVSGVIWGLWHAPLILKGYNFGSDHPKLGLFFMCIACIFYGTFFTWLTKRTNSIYPAAICHSCINNLPLASLLTAGSQLPDGKVLQLGILAMVIPAAVLSIYPMITIVTKRADKKDK